MSTRGSTRRVILIFGPPGAGKTTLAQTYDCKVYDRDEPQWRDEQHFTQAIRSLAHDPNADAVVIRSGAGRQSRSRTQTLVQATEMHILETDADTCIRRIKARNRGNVQRQIAGVRKWWRDYGAAPNQGGDPRSTRAWRKLRDRVVAEEPLCWLRLPGCTTISTTADHLLTVKARPDLAMERSNLRGACSPCNWRRNDKPIEAIRPASPSPALGFFG